MVRPGHVLAVVIGCMGPALWPALPARAQTEEQREEAKRRFSQGSEKFLTRHYAEALEDLRASHRLVPSPNSGLLIARCLKELKRPVEAYETYAAVAVDARKRAADGDPKYMQTAEAADAEGAVVRSTIGSIRVRVLHPPPGSSIEMDGSSWPANDTGIAVLHVPGEVQVKFRNAGGGEQSQRATVVSGAEVHVEFDAGAPTTPPPPPRPKDKIEPPPPVEGPPPGWTLPAALVAGGVTIVGAGVFVGFGLESESIYSRLQKRCGPGNCSAVDKSEADAGKRDQTIANVGLAVGIVGAASLITILLIRAYAPRDRGSATSHATVSPSGLHLTF
jgi:hypothetical protein